MGALAGLIVVQSACGGRAGGGDATVTQKAAAGAPTTTAPVPPMTTAAGVATAYAMDTSALRYEGHETTVLARMKGRPFITARDYNDWLGSYPLNITTQNPDEGFRQALEQMVMFKLMLSHAKKAGYENKVRTTGGVPDERSIVLLFIRDQISNISTVSDEMVREYEAANPGRFPQGKDRMPPEMLAMAVKGEIRGRQFTEEIKRWMEQEAVTFDLGTDASQSTTKSK